MPIFEYRCTACEATFDHLVRSAADNKPPECPHCGKSKTEKVMSVPAAPRSSQPVPLPRGGACGCGDPNGPCNI